MVGDLAFFYDLNALGNHYIKNNIRILLVNNGEGIEFKNYLHPAFKFGDAANEYFAARGHSAHNRRDWSVILSVLLGFEYRASTDKKSFLENIDWFTSCKLTDKPLVWEAFYQRSGRKRLDSVYEHIERIGERHCKKNRQSHSAGKCPAKNN